MTDTARPPRDNLVRALPGNCELRSANGKPAKLVGHLLVFNEWAEIDSLYEGHFMERNAPGCAAKTILENRDRMRALFHHGKDAQIGSKPLGPIAVLREDGDGVYYEVDPLLDTAYNAELLPGLRAGVYGSSYRFEVMQDEFELRPKRSDHNPQGLPERTITEVRIREFGPTPWPAYLGATASARSLTDEVAFRGAEPERRAQLLGETDLEQRDVKTRLYERTSEVVGDTIWAIHPAALATIVQIIGERRSGYKPSPEEIRERIGARDEQPTPTSSSVAVIPIVGTILPRADFFSEVSGGASIETVQAALHDALANDDVQAILLNIDSPGGSVALVPELASEILAARGSKPIVAIANTWAASAGYWIASAADELVVSPSGEVGSIGVLTAHDDISAMQEKLGVKTTLVSAAKYKVERNPFEPLSEEAQGEMQRTVDSYYRMFVDAVAKGRGVTAKEVRADFGEGRMVMAVDAVERGMADKVATFNQTLARLEKQARTTRTEPEPPAATTHDMQEPEPPAATAPAAARTEPEPSVVTTPVPRPRLQGADREEWRLP
jgi:signal peptide peptidase SppA